MRSLAPFASQWSALSTLLDEALSLPLPDREAWLAGLGGELAAHREPLRTLLAGQAGVETDDFLEALPPLDLRPADGGYSAGPGSELGAYRLIEEIGRGGMGTVWLAERADGLMQRRVALKLPRVVWGDAFAERLGREREILASLAHPHIARLYDAGVDAHGRPFLAMEYVQGEPIDSYCEHHAVPLRERVHLLLQVMAAVVHAHARLVVHRDLKPSNILVTAEAQACLLDFGVAKLLAGEQTQATALTELSGRALTLNYASPEQIRGEPLGAGTDIYSMAVVAYLLLTGRPPYRLRRASAAELEEAIASAEVPLASSAAPTPLLRKQLRGDLDAILHHALKKRPVDRYPTMEAFAQDLRRWLDGEPVQARPDRLTYRAAKFVRRHRLPVLAGAVATLALLGGTSVALWQAHQAGLQAQRARAEAATAQAVQRFLEGVFRANAADQADPAKARQTTARELLDRGTERINAELKAAPAARLSLLAVLAGMYQDLGVYAREIDLQRQRLALARELHGPASDESVLAMAALSNALGMDARRDEAAAQLKEATALLDARQDTRSAARLQVEIGEATLNRRVNPPRAIAAAERALVIARRGVPEKDLVMVLRLLGDASLYDRSFERARAAYSEAVQLCEAHPPLFAGELGLIYGFLGHAQRALGRYAEAEVSLRKGMEAEQARQADPVRVAETQTHYAIFLESTGRFRDSLAAIEPAWRWSQTAAPDLPQRRWVRLWHARILASYGQLQAALAASAEDLAVTNTPHKPDGMDEQALTDRAAALTAAGRRAEAHTMLERSRQSMPAGKSPGPLYGLALRRWQVANGQAAQALDGFQAARAARKLPSAPSAAEPVTEQAESAWLELAAGHPSAAEAQARQALASIERGGQADYQRDQEARAALVLGQALLEQRRAAEARPMLERAVALRRALHDPQRSLALADALQALAEAHRALGQPDAQALTAQAGSIRARARIG